mmetsp:Transcript_5302/g.17219  ORF Transcript_5302/g.17219 Transcript_5302/m.17219 type:complete len:206 (-) Transcript_5302:962-1579(-)
MSIRVVKQRSPDLKKMHGARMTSAWDTNSYRAAVSVWQINLSRTSSWVLTVAWDTSSYRATVNAWQVSRIRTAFLDGVCGTLVLAQRSISISWVLKQRPLLGHRHIYCSRQELGVQALGSEIGAHGGASLLRSENIAETSSHILQPSKLGVQGACSHGSTSVAGTPSYTSQLSAHGETSASSQGVFTKKHCDTITYCAAVSAISA